MGLAGLAGVAATGVVIVRAERRRRSYTPEEIREQLHARLAAAGEDESAAVRIGAADSPSPLERLRAWADDRRIPPWRRSRSGGGRGTGPEPGQGRARRPRR